MQRDSKDPNLTINLLHSYLRIPFSPRALFSFKRLKSTSNANETDETVELFSSTLQTYSSPPEKIHVLEKLPQRFPLSGVFPSSLPQKHPKTFLKLWKYSPSKD